MINLDEASVWKQISQFEYALKPTKITVKGSLSIEGWQIYDGPKIVFTKLYDGLTAAKYDAVIYARQNGLL